MPAISQAAFFTSFDNISSITQLGVNISSIMWKIAAVVALVCFVLAGIMFMTAQGQPDKIETAKKAVIWGVVGIIVAIIAYSIINIIGNSLQSP